MLQNLLLSLRKGTRVPNEVIVVDNDPEASADPAPIAGLPVHVLHTRLGLSLSGARNAGWRKEIRISASSSTTTTSWSPKRLLNWRRRVLNVALALLVPSSLPVTAGLCGVPESNVLFGRAKPVHPRRESTMPMASEWETDDMPDAFAIPRDVLERLRGFDENQFPIHYDEADVNAAYSWPRT